MFIATRFASDHLIRDYLDLEHTRGPGYICEIFAGWGGIRETLGTDTRNLRSNEFNLRQPSLSRPWTAEEANGFMAANGIRAVQLHFDCAELGSLIMNASIAATGTTDVLYSQMMR